MSLRAISQQNEDDQKDSASSTAIICLIHSHSRLNYRLLKAGIMFAISLSKGKHTAFRPSNINPLLEQLTGELRKEWDPSGS